MAELCDLRIHVNTQQTFFLNEKIISKFSGKLQKIIRQEKRRTQIIEIDDFPGGPDGFEMVSRFSYNNGGGITITVSNVSLLHCCSVFLGMTEEVSPYNLLHQTETFLEGMFYWSWSELLSCLGSTESFFSYADSVGLVESIICSLLAKIGHFASSSSSSSSPETSSSSSTQQIKPWWFDELTILPPVIIERFIKALGAYGTDNNTLVLTRFLLHYLQKTAQSKLRCHYSRADYGGLADTAVHGVVVLMGKNAFSCRRMFWVLRIVANFGVSRDCKNGLEREIARVLDQATLDDLLVCGGGNGGVYDVNLVLRLIRLFVHNYDEVWGLMKMKKVGRLIDKYLREIAPDHSLKMKKFLWVAESLPDGARDCFDGVYRAIEIYLESHPSLSMEERSRVCRCVSYKKLSLEACKDLAKNPRIPPRVAVEALASQHSNIIPQPQEEYYYATTTTPTKTRRSNQNKNGVETYEEESDEMRLNLQRMQWRVVELEKVCRGMKGQMSRVASAHTRPLPRLC